MAVSSPDLKAFLVATPLFGGLSDASLDLLISMVAERRFDDGAIVVAEGEPGRSMYVVHTGELVVSKLGELGRAIWMTCLGPGDFFGEMTLIEVQNWSATVVAVSVGVIRFAGLGRRGRIMKMMTREQLFAAPRLARRAKGRSIGGWRR